MLTQAQIFLQSQRGHFQTNGFRSFRTFNFAEYRAEGRESLGKLLVVNDETLLAQYSHVITVEESCRIVLIPLVGGIELDFGKDGNEYVDSGEVLSFFADSRESYTVTNPYAEEAVNYLQIRLSCDQSDQRTMMSKFDLLHKNTLLPAYSGESNAASIYIGKYEGREEGVFVNDISNRGIFAFVIEGAFEVHNRLLEKRDGLSVCGADEIEFEALSNDAVILMVQA